MQKKPAVDVTSRKVIEYLKIIFIALLVAIEIIICADAYDRVKAFNFYIALACCVILLVLETVLRAGLGNYFNHLYFYRQRVYVNHILHSTYAVLSVG